MNTFSRLNLLTLLFLGIVLMFVGGTTDVYAQEASLQVSGDTGAGKVYDVGDRMETVFTATHADHEPVEGADLTITHVGLTDVTISNGGTTDEFGEVVVTGVFTGPGDAFIQARWDDPLPHFDILTSTAVFEVRGPLPPTIQVFNKYKETFKHPDVHEHFPDVLRTFKNPEIQSVLNPVVINHFVRDPEYIRAFYPDIDESIITLLTTDNGFRMLFEDEQFQGVLQNPAGIDELVRLIEAQPLLRPEVLTLGTSFTKTNPYSGAPQGTITISAYTTAQRTVPEVASIRLSAGAAGNWKVKTSTRAGGRERWSVTLDTTTVPDTITKDNPGARNAALDNNQYTVRAVAIGADGTEWPSNRTARFSVDNVDDVSPVGPTNIVSVADADGQPIEANEDGSYTVGGLISPVVFTVQPEAKPATYNSVNLVQTAEDDTETTTQGTSGQLEFTVNVGEIEDGTYTFHALAVDAAGNIQTDRIEESKITVHVKNHERQPRRATNLSIVSGNRQTGEVGEPLAQPFVVGVQDQDGKPLQGIVVTFAVTAGDGRLSGTMRGVQLTGQTSLMIPTDVYGQARTTLTLGARAGLHSVTARAAGITQTQTFTATADAPPPPPPSPEPEPVVPVRSSTEEPPMYWIAGNTIYYRPTGGGKETFNEPQSGTLTGGLAVDMGGGKVYWTERTSDNIGRIQSADLDGSNLKTVKEISAVPRSIAFDAKDKMLYWTNSRGRIQRIKVGGGRVENFEEDLKDPNHIAFDVKARRLYWTVADGIYSIYTDNDDGIPRLLKTGDLGEVRGIAVFNEVVYWTEQTGSGGKVRSMHRTGKDDKLLDVAVLEEIIPGGIAVDAVGQKVYWTTSHGIRSKPLTGGTVVISEEEPAGIALGGTASEPAIQGAPSLSPAISVENTLLANYPNPFNPETWIPYQLSASADVSVSIYAVDGRLVRWLDLGHQVAGVYRSRSRAAYWDGRNEFGERVASGLYFYTLTAGDFTATRKMLIRK